MTVSRIAVIAFRRSVSSIRVSQPSSMIPTKSYAPYCGHRYEDSYECGGNDEYFEEECENCGREFNVTRYIDISYGSKPMEATEE